MAPRNSPMKYFGTSPPSMFPLTHRPTVTAGFRWAPLNWPTAYTAIMTAMPHPKVMTIQPEFWAFEWFNRTAATTPSPMRIRMAVPIISAPMMLNETPLLERRTRTVGPRRDPGGDPIRGKSRKSTEAVARRRPCARREPPGDERSSRGLARADRRGTPGVGRRRRGGPRRGAAAVPAAALLGVEPGLDAGHRLVAVLAVQRADRRTEAHGDRIAVEDHPGAQALLPRAPGRHRLARPGDVDRHDRDAVRGREDGGAGVQLAARAVARARALRVQEQVPALAQEAVQVVGRAVLHAAAAPRDRNGAEHERHGGREPALAVEVVGRGGNGGPLTPRTRQGAQDRRRVHVARVVCDEDHRRGGAPRDRPGPPVVGGGARAP